MWCTSAQDAGSMDENDLGENNIGQNNIGQNNIGQNNNERDLSSEEYVPLMPDYFYRRMRFLEMNNPTLYYQTPWHSRLLYQLQGMAYHLNYYKGKNQDPNLYTDTAAAVRG